MPEQWFKPKTHGYGASPSNWKGWAATLGFVAISAALTVPFIVMPALALQGQEPSAVGITAYVLLLFTFARSLYPAVQLENRRRMEMALGRK